MNGVQDHESTLMKTLIAMVDAQRDTNRHLIALVGRVDGFMADVSIAGQSVATDRCGVPDGAGDDISINNPGLSSDTSICECEGLKARLEKATEVFYNQKSEIDQLKKSFALPDAMRKAFVGYLSTIRHVDDIDVAIIKQMGKDNRLMTFRDALSILDRLNVIDVEGGVE